jgi:methionyl-tRNA formyltransferase
LRIAFLTNNGSSLELAGWIRKTGDQVIVNSEKTTVDWAKSQQIDFIVSYNYKHIVKHDLLEAYDDKIINLHISMLPWNRGADPNIWSFIEDTPKGVTIHRVDPGLDTGEILIQKECFFELDKESFSSTYNTLQSEICTLFKENWDFLKNNSIKGYAQSFGSFHYKRELDPYRSNINYNNIIQNELVKLKNQIYGI